MRTRANKNIHSFITRSLALRFAPISRRRPRRNQSAHSHARRRRSRRRKNYYITPSSSLLLVVVVVVVVMVPSAPATHRTHTQRDTQTQSAACSLLAFLKVSVCRRSTSVPLELILVDVCVPASSSSSYWLPYRITHFKRNCTSCERVELGGVAVQNTPTDAATTACHRRAGGRAEGAVGTGAQISDTLAAAAAVHRSSLLRYVWLRDSERFACLLRRTL